MGIWKKLTALLVIFALGVFIFLSSRIVETNQAENYQVKQAAISGELTVRSEPGMYNQWFGGITTYRIADDYHFTLPNVLFRDGSTATITGTVRYRMPNSIEQRLQLHREFRTYENVKILVKNSVAGALEQAAKLFGAEEVYSTDSAEFIEIFKNQINDGLYKTVRAGQVNKIDRKEDGSPKIAKASILAQYGIAAINIEIGSPDFDEKTKALIASRKDAEQQETLARAEAERAKQDAITAEERGKAQVAKAKYEALVIKEREVIEAEKKTAIEKEKTLQAFEFAQQEKARGEAEAFRQRELVKAGLSPREQAEIDRDTAIGVAAEIAKTQFPQIVFQGGGSDGAGPDPLDVIALERMLAIPKTMVPSTNQ